METEKPVKIDYHVLMRLRLYWMAKRDPVSLRRYHKHQQSFPELMNEGRFLSLIRFLSQ